MSPYPDINVHERQPTDDLLLLACDGLWDVMTSAEAVAQVRELFQSGETSVTKIAEEMLDVSLNKGEEIVLALFFFVYSVLFSIFILFTLQAPRTTSVRCW